MEMLLDPQDFSKTQQTPNDEGQDPLAVPLINKFKFIFAHLFTLHITLTLQRVSIEKLLTLNKYNRIE